MNVPKYERVILPVSNLAVFMLLQEYNTTLVGRKKRRK
jgi:hypothetical protein